MALYWFADWIWRGINQFKGIAEKALEFIKLLAFRDAIWGIEGKPGNEKRDVTFNFKTFEGLEHFEKIRREIDLD